MQDNQFLKKQSAKFEKEEKETTKLGRILLQRKEKESRKLPDLLITRIRPLRICLGQKRETRRVYETFIKKKKKKKKSL